MNKSVLALMSLLVISLFLVGCNKEGLAGEAVKISKNIPPLNNLKLCGEGYTQVPGAPFCKSSGLNQDSAIGFKDINGDWVQMNKVLKTGVSIDSAWVTFDCIPKKLRPTEKLGNCPKGTETFTYETHYICKKKDAPFKFEGCLPDYQLKEDYSNKKIVGGDYFVICKKSNNFDVGASGNCGDYEATVLFSVPYLKFGEGWVQASQNYLDYGKHCCSYLTTIIPDSFCAPLFTAEYQSCAYLVGEFVEGTKVKLSYICKSDQNKSASELLKITTSENACGNSGLFNAKAVESWGKAYCCVSK